MRIALALTVLLMACLPHSWGHQGMKHLTSMDTEEGMSRSIGQEQNIGNTQTDEQWSVLGKSVIASHEHHQSKKSLARKHSSHRRYHTAQGGLEDRSPGLEEGAMRSKEPKECKCNVFPLRRRRHGKFSRKKSMTQRCMKHCMKERRKQRCHREPCHMDIAMPLS